VNTMFGSKLIRVGLECHNSPPPPPHGVMQIYLQYRGWHATAT
jgi:hypothetical protein